MAINMFRPLCHVSPVVHGADPVVGIPWVVLSSLDNSDRLRERAKHVFKQKPTSVFVVEEVV